MRLFLLLVCLVVAPLSQAQSLFVEGRDYQVIDPPHRPTDAKTIEVTEVFGYTCIHCAHAAAPLAQWAATQPSDVRFVLLPAVFGGPTEAFARGFYAAQAQGLVDATHEALFQAIHVNKKPFRSVEDIASFYAGHGADKEAFLAAMTSFGVNAKIAQATRQIQGYAIEGTPTLIVNGAYKVMPQGNDPGFARMLQVVEHLIERERQASVTP